MSEYLRDLSSAAPTPGGGSAAAMVGALGAALVAMVARICAANPKYAAHAALTDELIASSDRRIAAFQSARERDERAFAGVLAAQRLAKETADQREQRRHTLDAALSAAADAPLAAMQLCLDVLSDAARLLEIPNEHLRSDVGAAAEFAFAALQACAYNVRVNHRYASARLRIEQQTAMLAQRERQARETLDHIRAAVAQTL